MTIKNDVLKQISLIADKKHCEIGGILGSSQNGIITNVVFDLPNKTNGCRFEYYPNTTFLNEQIETWAENGIEFLGLFHTHFSGSCSLSETDKEYITEIMESVKEIIEYLYFPIFTLPDNVLSVYKAFFINGKVIIKKDELIII